MNDKWCVATEVTPENIWNYRQNDPELVVRDARELLGLTDEQCDVLRTILLARGVNKWLWARLWLVRYKHLLKAQIKQLQEEIQRLRRDDPRRRELVLRMRTLTEVRSCLRAICHGPRWVEWRDGRVQRVVWHGVRPKWRRKLWELYGAFSWVGMNPKRRLGNIDT